MTREQWQGLAVVVGAVAVFAFLAWLLLHLVKGAIEEEERIDQVHSFPPEPYAFGTAPTLSGQAGMHVGDQLPEGLRVIGVSGNGCWLRGTEREVRDYTTRRTWETGLVHVATEDEGKGIDVWRVTWMNAGALRSFDAT